MLYNNAFSTFLVVAILARVFGTVVLMIPNFFTVEGGIAMALLYL
ncbi:hypothetical protein KOF85_000410 [Streptococcus mitis]|nr:hypothetical protein [Streptococcus mitis]